MAHVNHRNTDLHFWYAGGTKPVMATYNGHDYGYVYNLQGDVIALADLEAEGTPEVVRYAYDAWGKPLLCEGTLAETLGKENPFRYRGYVYDEETGLYYLRTRYYNPEWGRFLSVDSVLGTMGELREHNLFMYCGNNPVDRVDEDGNAWAAVNDGGGSGPKTSSSSGSGWNGAEWWYYEETGKDPRKPSGSSSSSSGGAYTQQGAVQTDKVKGGGSGSGSGSGSGGNNKGTTTGSGGIGSKPSYSDAMMPKTMQGLKEKMMRGTKEALKEATLQSIDVFAQNGHVLGDVKMYTTRTAEEIIEAYNERMEKKRETYEPPTMYISPVFPYVMPPFWTDLGLIGEPTTKTRTEKTNSAQMARYFLIDVVGVLSGEIADLVDTALYMKTGADGGVITQLAQRAVEFTIEEIVPIEWKVPPSQHEYTITNVYFNWGFKQDFAKMSAQEVQTYTQCFQEGCVHNNGAVEVAINYTPRGGSFMDRQTINYEYNGLID